MIVRESKWSSPGPRGIGPTWRRSTCEKDHAKAVERERYVVTVIVLESDNGNKGTLHQMRVRQRRKSFTDEGEAM